MADTSSPCCSAPRPDNDVVVAHVPPSQVPRRADGESSRLIDWVELPAGSFLMGCDRGEGFVADGEGPVRRITLGAFAIGATPVTNAQFDHFVHATGYITDAELVGSSFVFRAPERSATGRLMPMDWWSEDPAASWRTPTGNSAAAQALPDHPVVHVSWNDAAAFSSWVGGRLPTEAEWECAARGGLVGARFPWGDELIPEGEWRCNIWQGDFPFGNDEDDGFAGTSPVRNYPPNDFGLYDVSGNVWEWCQDWFGLQHVSHGRKAGSEMNPVGPPGGDCRVTRGGSFLCHDSYCNRYRVAARSGSPPLSTAANLGFRVARTLGSR